mmetsp:Transcript_16277/g.36075  ORF Transcript_16277/g.36075 Transcript_16277/m.36075 type:complete len:96 (+) Transcript_16277:1-288(+)
MKSPELEPRFNRFRGIGASSQWSSRKTELAPARAFCRGSPHAIPQGNHTSDSSTMLVPRICDDQLLEDGEEKEQAIAVSRTATWTARYVRSRRLP